MKEESLQGDAPKTATACEGGPPWLCLKRCSTVTCVEDWRQLRRGGFVADVVHDRDPLHEMEGAMEPNIIDHAESLTTVMLLIIRVLLARHATGVRAKTQSLCRL